VIVIILIVLHDTERIVVIAAIPSPFAAGPYPFRDGDLLRMLGPCGAGKSSLLPGKLNIASDGKWMNMVHSWMI
jgi:hypothetical protein